MSEFAFKQFSYTNHNQIPWISHWNSLTLLSLTIFMRNYFLLHHRGKHQSLGYGDPQQNISMCNHLKQHTCLRWLAIIPIANSSHYTSSHGKHFCVFFHRMVLLFTADQLSSFHFCGFHSLFSVILLHAFGTLLYHLSFDKRRMNHPKFLKNQIWLEFRESTHSLAIAFIFITPLLLLEVRGYAKLYDTTADGPGWWYNVLQIPLFLLSAEFCFYWIHRLSHHPRVYRYSLFNHKVHHRFVIPTPYATGATHPIEGITFAYLYNILAFIFPFQKMIHMLLIVFLVLWNVRIHAGTFLINGGGIFTDAAVHSLHHKYHNCNFGQSFVFFDRLFGTYREPDQTNTESKKVE